MNHWKHLKYKNLTIFALGVVIAFVLIRQEWFSQYLLNLGSLGYIGAFLAGILFVVSFTMPTGSVILFALAQKLSPVEIGLLAGLGGVVGDLTILHIIKDDLAQELKPLYKRFGGDHASHVLHSKYFHWTLPVLGAIIIASPFPDEVGVSLMGISKMKIYQFAILSFLLNATGIFLVISASVLITR